ncbi:hypothetical protein [Thalassospira indica]|uniref:Capsule polysaccharide biosynthesis protein n=1 Tax=Thalassospira indica TaxID=1891279 RepID=A0ABN5NDU7_9PROT|nr:hypothetical protein [Thalassospira indica]AXO13646.1 hypothetical protein DY252_04985 [Thalassospira indica]OAZ14472.1 hypothetical protein TH15_01255 [Thalassospira profundimaris]
MSTSPSIPFTVCTIGWEPWFIDYLLGPVTEKTGIRFVNGIVGDSTRIDRAKNKYPEYEFFALSKSKAESLPSADLKFLSQFEHPDVPTIKSMIQGDRVLRHRPIDQSLGYATLLAKNLQKFFDKYQPDLVLGSYDSLHAGLGFAVAKSHRIPWVAMAFTVIPDNLTGFCNALTPDNLVPLEREEDEKLKDLAQELMNSVRKKRQSVLAYKPPGSVLQWVKQYSINISNFFRRQIASSDLGIDLYTFNTSFERARDIVRRFKNRALLPTKKLLMEPPQGRYIYFPLHMSPESMLDTWAPFYQDQLAFIATLSLSVPVDVSLVVKLHFSDPDNYTRTQLCSLMRRPNLFIAHPNASGHEFLINSDLVVGIQGTSSLEAALLGKPVLLFGDSPYQHFPQTERAKTPDKLHAQILAMLSKDASSDEEILKAYTKYLSRYQPGRINDWSREISAEDAERYANCFQLLKNHILSSGVRDTWYE